MQTVPAIEQQCRDGLQRKQLVYGEQFSPISLIPRGVEIWPYSSGC